MNIVSVNYMILTINTVCNLNCKLCATGIPFVHGTNYPVEEVLQYALRAMELIDHVGHFDLCGGETLLHPKIHEIVKETAKLLRGKCDELRILTNGTIIPNDQTIDSIHETTASGMGFLFLIDNYALPGTKIGEVTKKLTAAGIPYRENVYTGDKQFSDGWVDYKFDESVPTVKHDTESAARETFRDCYFSRVNMWEIGRGKLLPCCYLFTRDLMGQFLAEPGEYVDLFDDTMPIEKKREIIRSGGTRGVHYGACKYCCGLGKNTPRFSAAEQMAKAKA
ncbi:hypothetical protein FACS1894167_05190 [Synergistales bacterium]|nr:hypothetical protein FACS1894167_05190 [Synergistales bacterium]